VNFNEAIDKLEVRFRQLKRDYELYFKGDLRREPLMDRQKLQTAINKLLAMHITNTAVKFRVQTLSSSFIATSRFWDRIVQQIEAGTYKADRFKADMRVGRFNPDTKEVERPAFEPLKRPSAEQSVADKRLRSLYSQFIEARRVTGESTKVSYDAFKKSVSKQRPTLEKKYGNKLRFKVVIEDGKTKLKGFSK